MPAEFVMHMDRPPFSAGFADALAACKDNDRAAAIRRISVAPDLPPILFDWRLLVFELRAVPRNECAHRLAFGFRFG
jgi:hypothetical protein